jgi:hypothetical protein
MASDARMPEKLRRLADFGEEMARRCRGGDNDTDGALLQYDVEDAAKQVRLMAKLMEATAAKSKTSSKVAIPA